VDLALGATLRGEAGPPFGDLEIPISVTSGTETTPTVRTEAGRSPVDEARIRLRVVLLELLDAVLSAGSPRSDVHDDDNPRPPSPRMDIAFFTPGEVRLGEARGEVVVLPGARLLRVVDGDGSRGVAHADSGPLDSQGAKC
jgi:hypothetical protein